MNALPRGRIRAIAGRCVRVRPGECRDLAVQEPSHRHLLRRCIGVEIHEHDLRLFLDLRYGPFSGPERIIDGLHVDASLHVQHAGLPLLAEVHDDESVATVVARIVQRTEDAAVRTQHLPAVPPVPHMIARRDDMGAEGEDALRMFFRDPFPFGDVLAVDDQQIDIMFLDESRNERSRRVRGRGYRRYHRQRECS